jgi:biotin carboxylase
LGASVSQLDAIRRARATGFRVVAVDGDPGAVAFADADEAEVVDFSDIDAVTEVACRYAVDGVVAISTDRAVPVAAAVAERLGLPGIGSLTAAAMTNKATMRSRLTAAGVRQPDYAFIDGNSDVASLFDRIGAPAVLKPVDSGGQRGVALIHDLVGLEAQLPKTLAFSRSRCAILERYVEGSELNGIIVVAGGVPHLVSLSDRLRPPGPGFGVGWIHLFPSGLDPALLARAEATAIEAVVALGLKEGIAFPQLLVTSDDVFVVEVAARIAAGQMADLVHFGLGVDLVEIALLQATLRKVTPELWLPKFEQPLAIRFFTAQPGVLPVGRIVAIDGLEDVRKSRGVVKAELYMRLGETIAPARVDAHRRGYVIATADDPRQALELADHAAARLVVHVAPPDEVRESVEVDNDAQLDDSLCSRSNPLRRRLPQ